MRSRAPSPDRRRRLAALQSRIGCTFSDAGLLELALIHPSVANEEGSARTLSNQRLEFLGDAVVDLAVAQELYRRHPDWSEGRLTSVRSALVSGQTLAAAAASIDLGEYLVLGRGEEALGGRARESNLAAALESVVGARLLDAGYDAALELVLSLLGDRLDEAGEGAAANPKSELQELVQARGWSPPQYRIVEQSGEPHLPSFVAEVEVNGRVAGRGSGTRKASAEQAAARQALIELS